MCGIAAVLHPARPAESLRRDVRAMNHLQAHRGPDAEGMYVRDGIGLGHRRLSIIGVDEAGNQPMTDGRRWLVFNGEIYNYRELRRELGEERFRTRTDSEVILVGYEAWGERVLDRLRGMFSFVMWDPRDRTLFAARDRFGIKPLYVSRHGGAIRFASEAKALLPFLDGVRTDGEALLDYVALQLPIGSKTLFEGIEQVPAAHWAKVDAQGRYTTGRYWEVFYDRDFDHTERYFFNRLEALLEESVALHIRADVPIGGYVSGGVDSSLVSIMAAEAGDFVGFTGKFTEPDGYDESEFAMAAARTGGFELLERSITGGDFVGMLGDVIYHLDHPVAGPGSFPQFAVSALAAEHRKVVLGGQGGDEIFGGYARYLVAYLEQAIKGAIQGTADGSRFILTYESVAGSLRGLKGYEPMLASLWSDGLFGPRDERYMRLIDRSGGVELKPDFRLPGYDPMATALQLFRAENVESGSYFDQMTHFDFKTLLPGLLQVEDRVSMAHGLEARVPLLDHRIVEFAARIPSSVKFRNGELKRLLRHAMAHRLPGEIVARTDKMGFPVPIRPWLSSNPDVAGYVKELLAETTSREEFPLVGLSFDDLEGVSNRGLWAHLSLGLWFRRFHDRAADFRSLTDTLIGGDVPIDDMTEETT